MRFNFKKFIRELPNFDELYCTESNKVSHKAFSYMRMPNGTFKTTYRCRFVEVDQLLIDILKKRFLKKEKNSIKFLDVGVSSGISTVEFLSLCRESKVNVDAVCTDLYPLGKIEQIGQSFYRLSVDKTSVMFGIKNFSIRGFFAFRDLTSLCGFFGIFYRPMAEFLFKAFPRLVRESYVHLLCEELQDLVSLGRAQVLKCDVLDMDDIYTGAHVTRFANILNPSYFTNTEIRSVVSNYLSSASEGAVVVFGRTDIGPNREYFFDIYEVASGKLMSVKSIGSEEHSFSFRKNLVGMIHL